MAKRKKRDKPIPDGAVRADPHRQVHGLGGPLPYYEDMERTCVQCTTPFVFSAREQKYWYETLGFINYSRAIRCRRCRRRKRDEVTLQRQVASARESVRDYPNDPLAHLALAEALVHYHRMTSTGSLKDAVAAARKAGRLDPSLPEAVYWEATSLVALAGQRHLMARN